MSENSAIYNHLNEKTLFMNILHFTTATLIGMLRGKAAKSRYVYKIESRQEDKRLSAFWKQKGLLELDEMEIRAYHYN